jgi:hypothetical protein
MAISPFDERKYGYYEKNRHSSFRECGFDLIGSKQKYSTKFTKKGLFEILISRSKLEIFVSSRRGRYPNFPIYPNFNLEILMLPPRNREELKIVIHFSVKSQNRDFAE